MRCWDQLDLCLTKQLFLIYIHIIFQNPQRKYATSKTTTMLMRFIVPTALFYKSQRTEPDDTQLDILVLSVIISVSKHI